jgi:hypothetical protein
MRTILIASSLVLTILALAPPAFAGPCDHSWQRAADGSRCGGRAADQRDGGSDGW